ncbi:MAG: hypothetical protein AB7P99_08725 [Vicinamibacterales bacterium]
MPLRALLHRSGLFAYLKSHWREDARKAAEAAAAAVRKDLLQAQARTKPEEPAAPRLEALALEVRRLTDVLNFNAEHRERAHTGAFAADRVLAHVRAAVREAPMVTAPAPHMRVPAVLPDDTYRALLAALPPDSCFSQRDPKKQNFKPRQQDLAPEFSMQAWRFFEEQVVPQALLPAILDRFRPHLSEAYRDKYGAGTAAAMAAPLVASRGRLMLRRPGYRLAPHLDPRRVLVTCLVYFAQPGDNEEYGTQLFAIDSPPAIDRDNTYFPEDHGHRCDPIGVMPFQPNTAVVFVNHGIAHGAEIPATAPARTRRYAYQFYVAPDERAPLEPDLQP